MDRPTGIAFGSGGKIYWLDLGPPIDVPATSPSGLLLLALALAGAGSLQLRRRAVRERG